MILEVTENADLELLNEATETLQKRFQKDWHVVAAAIRLHSGEMVSGIHLEANVGRIAVCAEAIALGRAVTQLGSSEIHTIVAVRHGDDGGVRVVSPCGMCREMISDYSPEAIVLMPSATGFVRQQIELLIPGKYSR